MAPTEPPWRAIKEWLADEILHLNWFNQERKTGSGQAGQDPYEQSPSWQTIEFQNGDGRILALDDS